MSLENFSSRATSCKKTKWTDEEDNLLKRGVSVYGLGKWTKIASFVPGRSPKQCRERWTGQLDPTLNHDMFSKEEDDFLRKLHANYGNSWSKIAQHMPGRCPNSVKNRYRFITKRRSEKKIPPNKPPIKIQAPVAQETTTSSSESDIFTLMCNEILDGEDWI